MPVSGIGSPELIAPSSDLISSRSEAMSEFDFLKLLVAQMTNQDPLSPMEGTEFASQLADFSSLEELQKMSSYLSSSLEANLLLATSINNSMATTLIGKTIQAETDIIELGNTGEAQIQFRLDSAATEVSVEIVDENGETVRTLSEANLATGENSLQWDGLDEEGNRVDSGNYQVKVTAKDGAGASITTTVFFEGRVTGVVYRDGIAILMVGSREVNLGDVTAVLDGNPQVIPIG